MNVRYANMSSYQRNTEMLYTFMFYTKSKTRPRNYTDTSYNDLNKADPRKCFSLLTF